MSTKWKGGRRRSRAKSLFSCVLSKDEVLSREVGDVDEVDGRTTAFYGEVVRSVERSLVWKVLSWFGSLSG